MNKRNYQKELDALIARCQAEERIPTLLLHVCCAPCSSYCLEYLSQFFRVTVFYYNPNITKPEEYAYRLSEEHRYVAQKPFLHPVTVIDGEYEPRRFFEAVRGLEQEPEGGKRCEQCFRLRLEESAKKAKTLGFDYFTTTLTISPLKDAQLLNAIGFEMAQRYGVNWLPSDFKKREGYKRSIELSREYDLYRQNYCGCVFSQKDAVSL